MKIKNLLSSICAVSCVALSFVACSDYDNGFTDKEIAYERHFRDMFGEISPEQDWNLATRATVNVTTSQPSNVKIYAYDGKNYSIVGDYSNVIGSRTLGFDVVKGVEKILVTDGRTGQKTTVGGSVSFDGRGTRMIHTDAPEGIISTTGMYIEFTKAQAEAYQSELPEGGQNGENGDHSKYEYTNLPKVTKDFKYISNGPFTLIPVFWHTSHFNQLGVYYTDDDGEYHEVVFYTMKEKGYDAELQDLRWRYIYVDDFKVKDFDEAIIEAQKQISNNGTFGTLVGADQPWTKDNAISFIEWDNKSQRFYITDVDGNRYIMKYYYNKGDTDEITEETCTHNYFRVYEILDTEMYDASTKGYDSGYRNPPTDTQRAKEIVINIPEGVEFGMFLRIDGINDEDHNLYSEASKNKHKYPFKFGEPYSSQNACFAASIDIDDEKYLCFEDWTGEGGDFDLNDVVLKFSGNIPEVIDNDVDPSSTWDILCEDLGGSHDYDFNDIVLKVEHVSGRPRATVTPLAAGGTLASYTFFYNGDTHTIGREIHQRFGVGSQQSGDYEPIDVIGNTINYRRNEGVQVEFDVPEGWSLAYYRADSYGKGSDESVWWDDSDEYKNMGGLVVKVLPRGTNAPQTLAFDSEYFENAAVSIVASPDKGDTPQMICVPDQYYVVTSDVDEEGNTIYYRNTYKFAWSQELVPMKESYGETFSKWVESYGKNGNTYSEGTDWYKNPNEDKVVYRVPVGSPVLCDEEGNVEGGDPNDPDNPNGPDNPTIKNDYSIYGTPISLGDYTLTGGTYSNPSVTNAFNTSNFVPTEETVTLTYIVENPTWINNYSIKGYYRNTENPDNTIWESSDDNNPFAQITVSDEKISGTPDYKIVKVTMSKDDYSQYEQIALTLYTDGIICKTVYIE